MNEYANPLDYILKYCEQGLVPKVFTIQNAKDELKKMRQQLTDLQKNESHYYNIGCVQVNNNGDLYCPRFYDNPYIENTIPIYANKEELKKWLDKDR